MADQAILRAHVGDHRRGDLAGVGALLVAAHVLGAELEAALLLEILDQVAQVWQRRQHHDLDAGHRQARGHAAEQLRGEGTAAVQLPVSGNDPATHRATPVRSEEHTSELQSLMRTSYAVFCLKKKKNNN